jgi:Transcriptional regulator
MENKNEIRIPKAERIIKEVFLELLQKIGFSHITVKEITLRANINRSTFYAHFTDKYDLLDQVEDDLFMPLKKIVRETPLELIISQEISSDATMSYLRYLISYIHENGDTFALLQSEKGDPVFSYKLSTVIKTVWSENKILNRLSIPQNYAFSVITSIMISLIIEWVESNFKETPEEFLQILVKVIRGIHQNMFK